MRDIPGAALKTKCTTSGAGFALPSCCLEHELRGGAPAVTLHFEAILGLEAQPERSGVEGAKPGSLPTWSGEINVDALQPGERSAAANQERLCSAPPFLSQSLSCAPVPASEPPRTTPSGMGFAQTTVLGCLSLPCDTSLGGSCCLAQVLCGNGGWMLPERSFVKK